MENKKMFFLAGVVMVGVMVWMFYGGGGGFFQGRLGKDVAGGSCSSSWTRVFDGSVLSPVMVAGFVKLDNVSVSTIKSLEDALTNGCDFKLLMISADGSKGVDYICEDVFLDKNSNGGTQFRCKSRTPFSFGNLGVNFIYDEVVLSENNFSEYGEASYIAINRIFKSESGVIETWDNYTDWEWKTVRLFFRK